jgi:exo-beta-1,3-glucanase (GH17 family)
VKKVAVLLSIILMTSLLFNIFGFSLTLEAKNVNSYEWYFAEGYTGFGFQENLHIVNPTLNRTDVTVCFLPNNEEKKNVGYSIPENSCFVIDVNKEVGNNKEVSMIVSSSTKDLSVERSMYFEYGDNKWSGGHSVSGAISPSCTWHFAEGYTGQNFEEWVCVLNTSSYETGLIFVFQTQEVGEIVKTGFTAPANSRSTFNINAILGNDFQTSLRLESDIPIVAERSMYFGYLGTDNNYCDGGSCVMGTPALSNEYYFAEGTTRSGFDTWLTIQNSNDHTIEVNADYQSNNLEKTPVSKKYIIEPQKRSTVFLTSEIGEEEDVSIKLSSEYVFLSERSMYYNYGNENNGGDSVIGAFKPRNKWVFAEGSTVSGRFEWLCLQNCFNQNSTVRIRYLTENTNGCTYEEIEVPSGARITIPVHEKIPDKSACAVHVDVLSGPDIVSEISSYFSGKYNGNNASFPYRPAGSDIVLQGVCFSPYLNGNPDTTSISKEHIDLLVDKVVPVAGSIRTFSSRGDWLSILKSAHEKKMTIAAGCGITTNLEHNEEEIKSTIKQSKIADIFVVGDEILTKELLSQNQLIDYIRRVKTTGVPTTTSEHYKEWLEHPELVDECDLVIMNIFPHGEGVKIKDAISHLNHCYQKVKEVAGDKEVIVETGWPYWETPQSSSTQLLPKDASRYLSDFIAWASVQEINYYYFQAYDEKWKGQIEPNYGPYWGLWDAAGIIKPEIERILYPSTVKNPSVKER